MKNALFCAMVFISVSSSSAAFDFKGDPLGMPLTEFVKKYDRVTTDQGRRAPNLVIEAFGKPPTSFRKFSMVIVEKYFGFETLRAEKETVAGVPAKISYGFFASSLADWDLATAPRREQLAAFDKRDPSDMESYRKIASPRDWTVEERAAASRLLLGDIRIKFAKSSFSDVLAALEEKYGTPKSREVETKKNAMGVTFNSQLVKWASDGDMIEMSEIGHDLNTSSLEFIRRSVYEAASKASSPERKEAAKDL